MEKIKVKSKVNKDADFDIFMDGIKMTGDVVRSLIAIRKAKGLTQSDIANRCGIKQSAVARFEARVIIPRFDTVAKYAKAVGEKIAIAEDAGLITKAGICIQPAPLGRPIIPARTLTFDPQSHK